MAKVRDLRNFYKTVTKKCKSKRRLAKRCLFGNGHCYFSPKSSFSIKLLKKWFLIKKRVLVIKNEFMKYKIQMQRNFQIYLFIKHFQLRI